ncbi:protein NATD1 isoform X4 [Tamandua tetradactyla]|uniref:protein NATD1 isoform X4 n=1 Tax=Tamandua tetradactyla TaxID=48850 RepID=UPI004053D81A
MGRPGGGTGTLLILMWGHLQSPRGGGGLRSGAVRNRRRGSWPSSASKDRVLRSAALDFVVEEDLRAHLTCWYVQKYVKENPLPQYLERLQP